MKRRALTLIEFLIVIAILVLMTALLLPGIQKVRSASARAKCQNNLRQLGLAAHNYENAQRMFPPGTTFGKPLASVQLLLLPYLEQNSRYHSFDLTVHVTDPINHTARIAGDVPVYLCPADPSNGFYMDTEPSTAPPGPTGRCNYYGNVGAHGWWRDFIDSLLFKPVPLRGVFALGSQTRPDHILDGMSCTVLFAEVKRGAASKASSFDVGKLSSSQWNTASKTVVTNPNNLGPLPESFAALCNNASSTDRLTGLRYYDGSTTTSALYNHTLPPNYSGRDCYNSTARDQFHLASRSYHHGGVNVCLADGSVRFIRDSISLESWKALGTRSGGEMVTPDD